MTDDTKSHLLNGDRSMNPESGDDQRLIKSNYLTPIIVKVPKSPSPSLKSR